jgi:hypothetical protein
MSFRGLRLDLSTARMAEYDADGFLQVQVDGYSDDAQTLPFEMHSPFGFISRPVDQDPDGRGCTVTYAITGDDTHVWLGSDPRYVPLIPVLKQGGSAMYCKTGAFSVFDGETGGFTLYVPYNFNGTTPGKSMSISVDPEDESITIAHGEGPALFLTKEGVSIKNKSGSVFASITDEGITLSGPMTINGATNLGKQLVAYLSLLAANTKPPTPPPPPTLSLT